MKEKTCKCINEYKIGDFIFHKRREYQVDVCPLWYQVYNNGGWSDYVFLEEDEFNKYFKLID